MTGYDLVTQQILALLEKGTVPWRQPWRSSCPTNLFTQREYRGVNVFLLACQGFKSPYWATEKQIESHGGEVRWGQIDEPSTIFVWHLSRDYTWTHSGYSEIHPYTFIKAYEVFNFEQTQGLDRFVPPPLPPFTPVGQAEELVVNMPQRPRLETDSRGAYYYPDKDVVTVPPRESFLPPEEYYSTLFHELIHATGHSARLKRRSLMILNRFGDHAYSQEELVAEMGAAMLCGVTGIAPTTINNSASYINFWAHKIQSDKLIIMRAANHAQRASDFIRGKLAATAPSAQDDHEKDRPSPLACCALP